MNDIFTIGDFCFRLDCPAEIAIPDNFKKFRGGSDPAYRYTISLADNLPAPVGDVIARRPDLLVLRSGAGECRYIGVKGSPVPYACYQETAPDGAEVTVDRDQLPHIDCDPAFVSLLALERRQLALGGLILHCACICHDGEAILFSAPSGTGKSTQADLWARFRGAEVINGDRMLLQKRGGRWLARGWPVCGSSGICHNRDLPIRAVVNLSQAPVDRAQRMAPMQAFTRLYSEITINRWNRQGNLQVMELLEDLVTAVPAYHLACTMEESAVEALEAAMQEEGAR